MRLKGIMAVILAIGLLVGIASVSSAAVFDYATAVVSSNNVVYDTNATLSPDGQFATINSGGFLVVGFGELFWDLGPADVGVIVGLSDIVTPVDVYARRTSDGQFVQLTFDTTLIEFPSFYVYRYLEIPGDPSTSNYFNQIKLVYNTSPIKIDTVGIAHPATNGDGNGIPVPEPSTLLLLGSGLLGIVVIGRKKII